MKIEKLNEKLQGVLDIFYAPSCGHMFSIYASDGGHSLYYKNGERTATMQLFDPKQWLKSKVLVMAACLSLAVRAAK